MQSNTFLKRYLFSAARFILMMVFAVLASAEVFKWVDENGKVHYSDKKPEKAEAETVELKVNTYTNVSDPATAVGRGEKVIMYSTSWCGYCKKARAYFKSHDIAFLEYDIEKNTQAKRDYKKLGGSGVPVILLGKKRMNGFSESSFKRFYASARKQ